MYQQLEQQFTAKNGRRLPYRKLANNTYLERRGDDIAVRLHNTDVVTVRPDDAMVLDSGGWLTVTTKDRINMMLPAGMRLFSDKGRWYLQTGDRAVAYFDGLTINAEGDIINRSDMPDVEAQDEYNREVRRLVKRYITNLTASKVVRVFDEGGSGDCWYCLMRTREGEPLGEAQGSHGHLREHLEERYYMVSLFFNAIEARGFGNPQLIMGMVYQRAARGGEVDRLLKDALRNYFHKRLLRGVAVK